MKIHWYDYGARFYDPILGRFHTVDNLAERYYSWSPYNYVGGNPIKRVDPIGNDWWDVVNGAVRGVTDNMIGSNTRSNYTPADPSDYTSALKKADIASVVMGGTMTLSGLKDGVVGAVGAGETFGASLTIAGVGIVKTALGTTMVVNALDNLSDGNNKDRGVSTKRDNENYETDLEKAESQLEGIEEAQDKAKKAKKGSKQNRINSIKKTRQNLKKALKDLGNREVSKETPKTKNNE